MRENLRVVSIYLDLMICMESGKECGKIVWESKYTKAFAGEWTEWKG
jgi:hypothetical protein